MTGPRKRKIIRILGAPIDVIYAQLLNYYNALKCCLRKVKVDVLLYCIVLPSWTIHTGRGDYSPWLRFIIVCNYKAKKYIFAKKNGQIITFTPKNLYIFLQAET